jgi:hypothetical protein
MLTSKAPTRSQTAVFGVNFCGRAFARKDKVFLETCRDDVEKIIVEKTCRVL